MISDGRGANCPLLKMQGMAARCDGVGVDKSAPAGRRTEQLNYQPAVNREQDSQAALVQPPSNWPGLDARSVHRSSGYTADTGGGIGGFSRHLWLYRRDLRCLTPHPPLLR
jgi:hypothetical protein